MRKPLILALTFFGFFNLNAQITWSPAVPANFIEECSDDNNDQDILDYLNSLSATFAGCPNAAIITWDYSDPGDFDCGDQITIEITAEDDCGNEADVIVTIDVDIDDTVAPSLDTAADDQTVECGPNNAAELMNWVNTFADAEFDDDCTEDPDLVWTTIPDPVALTDLTLGCGANDGEVTVEFYTEDECGNQSASTFATFYVEDTTDPEFLDGPSAWDITFECDGSGNATDLSTWVSDIMSGIAVSDNCSDVTYVESTLTNSYAGEIFTDCDGPEIQVTFTIEDECGNTETYTATASLEDTADPVVTAEASDLILTCNALTNPGDVANWVAAFGNAVFTDDCTTDPSLLTITHDWSGTVPDCNDFETVTFTIEDECGNTVQTQADVIIDDFDPPVIDNIETNPAALECDVEEIQDGLIQNLITSIVNNAIGSDVNDCTLPNNLVWEFSPDPAPDQATTPDPNCVGVVAGLYEFDVVVIDECDNESAPVTVTIVVQDTEGPLDAVNLPDDEEYECESDVPVAPDLFAPDLCEGVPAIFDEVIDDTDPCDILITRTWMFEDACGNPGETHVQEISVVDDEGPEWLGDEDDYLPEDIDIVVANCDEGFSFPNGYFENEAEEEAWPIFPLMEGSEFEDNCGAQFIIIGPPPTEEFGEGCTPVEYIIEDECGNQLSHSFEVCIICANCAGGGVTCNLSCETVPACHTCNIEELLDGFESCTPEWTGGLEDWPSTLCNGAGVPHNISWFSFVAGGTDLCVEVAPFQCAQGSGSIGLQSGVYDFCEDDD